MNDPINGDPIKRTPLYIIFLKKISKLSAFNTIVTYDNVLALELRCIQRQYRGKKTL